jgi:carboxylesterase type B
VYVALNYRMGLFGFLNDVDGVFPNIGLQDQRLAFDWYVVSNEAKNTYELTKSTLYRIKKNIHLFGGNPDLVTVMGESAGGGSIMYHLTAEGGTKKFPFKRAIAQSAAFVLDIDNEDVWGRVLNTTRSITGKDISTAAELAQLDHDVLAKINFETVFNSPDSLYTFSTSVDGGYITKPPGVLLLEGKYDHSVDIMAGHNANETHDYVPPELDTEEKWLGLVHNLLPHIKDDDLDYILTNVYPPPEKTDLYADEHARGALLVAEMIFVCTSRYLALAAGNNTYNYRFQVPPASHGQDVPYTFFRGVSEGVEYPSLAVQMQRYFSKFVKAGNPNDKSGEMSLPEWPVYGDEALINTFGPDGAGDVVVDDARNTRCDYWQRSSFMGY